MRSKGFRSGSVRRAVKVLLGWARVGRTCHRELPPGDWLSSVRPAHSGGRTLWLLGSQQTG